MAPPTDLLLYVLWKNIINDGSAAQTLHNYSVLAESIKDWPCLPVSIGPGRAKRLYSSPALLTLLLLAPHSDSEDALRAGIVLEELRLSQEVLSSASEGSGGNRSNLSSGSNEWSWSRTPFSSLQRQYYCEAEGVGTSGSSLGRSTAAASLVQGDEARPNLPIEGTGSFRAEERYSELPAGHPLTCVLEALWVPFLDGAIFESAPMLLPAAPRLSLGRRLLLLIYTLFQTGSAIHSFRGEESGLNIDSEPTQLLRFGDLTTENRRALLLEFLNAHRADRFQPQEIEMLKALPLFTCRDDSPVAISRCSGVYWCTSEATLQSLSLPSAALSIRSGGGGSGQSGVESSSISSEDPVLVSQAVILAVDPALQEIYELVGAEQLTPALAVRRFTLPALNKMMGRQRLEIMRGVAEHWGSYRDDAELVRVLRAVAFIPAWHEERYVAEESKSGVSSIISTRIFSGESRTGESAVRTVEVEDYHLPMRCPHELFSWTNSQLIEALQGEHVHRYLPPSTIREGLWHVMMTDLGMMAELNKDSLIRYVNLNFVLTVPAQIALQISYRYSK